MKKQLMMAAAVAFTMGTAQADLYLDGLMSEADMQDYSQGFQDQDDLGGLYEFNGNYYDTFIDTTVDINTNTLFETGYDRTYFTDTGAATIYQARAGGTVNDVMSYYDAHNKKDIGFEAKILGGTINNKKITFHEMANGKFRSINDMGYDDLGNRDRNMLVNGGQDYTRAQVKWKLDGGKIDHVYKEGRFAKDRGWKLPTERVGVTADTIRELNKDHLEYTVKSGDGAWAIAKKLGITPEELYAANEGLEGRYLRTGEVLQRGSFAEGYHVKVKKWSQNDVNNKQSSINIVDKETYGQATYAEAPTTESAERLGYTVQSGDGAWAIAKELGMTPEELYAANEGLEGRYLSTGEVLYTGAVTFTNPEDVQIPNATPGFGAQSFIGIQPIMPNINDLMDSINNNPSYGNSDPVLEDILVLKPHLPSFLR